MSTEGPIGIYIVGTAGCGKSTLAAATAKWLSEEGLSASVLNLDPGAIDLPYEPDIDVREWITLGDVMEEYGLGPNGAQIVCADMLALELHRLNDVLKEVSDQFVVVDTPGQLELFAFREASREIVSNLFPDRSFMVYLVDPINSRSPSGYISQLMLASLSGLRFQIPMAQAISKMDLIQPLDHDRMQRWMNYPDALLSDAIEEASAGQTMNPQLAVGLFRALQDLFLVMGLNLVSSIDGSGLDIVYRTVQSVFMGGEDPERASGPVPEEG